VIDPPLTGFPVIDPWTFTISVSKDSAAGATHLSVNAGERLDVNLSTTFAEVAISTLNSWSKEGDVLLSKPRGAYAPYRIRNRTGTPLFIFSDVDSGVSMGEGEMTKVLNNHIIDWRFDDWKTMREVGISSSNSSHRTDFWFSMYLLASTILAFGSQRRVGSNCGESLWTERENTPSPFALEQRSIQHASFAR
jgi:hypothetical protein